MHYYVSKIQVGNKNARNIMLKKIKHA